MTPETCTHYPKVRDSNGEWSGPRRGSSRISKKRHIRRLLWVQDFEDASRRRKHARRHQSGTITRARTVLAITVALEKGALSGAIKVKGPRSSHHHRNSETAINKANLRIVADDKPVPDIKSVITCSRETRRKPNVTSRSRQV